MTRPLGATMLAIAIFASSSAFAQEQPKLPLHGWVRADVDANPVAGVGWVGVTVPFSRTTALAIDGFGGNTAAGLDVGPTIEIGALYLLPAAGFEYAYTGTPGIALQLQGVFEAPPLPFYVETWLRGVVRSPFSGDDTIMLRLAGLVTVRQWLALGVEYDGFFAPEPIASNKLGPRFNIGLGKHVALGIFGGYEFNEAAQDLASWEPGWLTGRGTINVSW